MYQNIEQFIAAVRGKPAALEPSAVHGLLTAAALTPDGADRLSWLRTLLGDPGTNPSVEMRRLAGDAVADIRATLQAGNFSPLIADETDYIRWSEGFVRMVALADEEWTAFNEAYIEAAKPQLLINMLADPELYAEFPVEGQTHRDFVRDSGPLLGPAVRQIAAYMFTGADTFDALGDEYLIADWREDELRNMSDETLIGLLTEHEDRVARTVIDECIRRGEAFVPYLHAQLNDERLWSSECGEGEWWAKLHAVHILGAIPGRAAAAALMTAMRAMQAYPDDNLWDWLAPHWPLFFRNKREHAAEDLSTLAYDPAYDWYPRYHALECLLEAAHAAGPQALDTMLDRMAEIVADTRADEALRGLLGSALLNFPRARHGPLLESMAREYESARTWGMPFGLKDVEHDYARGADRPDWERFQDYFDFYKPSAILARQSRWIEEDERADRRREQRDDELDWEPIEEPYVRAAPKTGRNDPCPCGSGKKYKKCCLQ